MKYIMKKIIHICIFIILLIILKIYTNETSEDKYHKDVHKDYKKINDSPLVEVRFNNKKHFETIYNNIKYNKIFSNHYNSIKKYNPNFILTDEDILSRNSNILKLNFNKEKNIFSFLLNHYYLGADSFLRIKSDIMNQKCINYPSSNFKSFILLPKFFYDYYSFINEPSFKALPRINKPKRYTENIIFNINEYKTYKKRTYILYKVLQKLYKYLQLNRPLRVMFPVPFKRFNRINNNVGAILLIFKGNETIEEFICEFEKKQYMALASNFLLISKINTLFTNNYKLRNQIDVVLTSIYSKKIPELEYSLNWSTQILPSESVYVGIYSRVGESNITTNITYSVATSSFVKTRAMKKYKLPKIQ